ncbi:cysteine-rich CWC family protein [Massilia antarctica]|uniref:cysteine-rich CWC family protein n=1 Tax=Massilia antarctica TaxID=2765360 RepID=UPI00249E7E8E|nr:cysteine-rich CWC family protein [Massilia antarctica]
MSTCSRCGAQFGCSMADGTAGPCWCTELPPVVAVPVEGGAAACWCPACLKAHIEARKDSTDQPAPDSYSRS